MTNQAIRNVVFLGALVVVLASCGAPEPQSAQPAQQAPLQQPTEQPPAAPPAEAPSGAMADDVAARLFAQQGKLETLVGEATRQLGALRSAASAQPAGAAPQPGASSEQIAEVQSLITQMGQQLEAMDQAALSEADLSGYEERILAAVGELKAAQAAADESGEAGAVPPSGGPAPVEAVSQTLFQMLGVLEQIDQLQTRYDQLGSAQGAEALTASATPDGEAVGGAAGAPPRFPRGLPRGSAQSAGIVPAGGTAGPRATTAPAVTRGYEGATFKAMVAYPSRLRLWVNGVPVGSYDSDIELGTKAFEPLLQPGAVNTISLKFDRFAKDIYLRPSWAELKVLPPGSDEWVSIYKFTITEDRLEDSFEFPFVGSRAN